MLGQERIRELAQDVLDRSAADQTEVVILSSDSALTRFANSTITFTRLTRRSASAPSLARGSAWRRPTISPKRHWHGH
jgi:hypothetical protein